MGYRYIRSGKGSAIRALLHMAAAAAIYFLTDSFGNEITGIVFRRMSGFGVFAAASLHVCLDILNIFLVVFLYGKYIVRIHMTDIYLGKPVPALRWCTAAVVMPLAVDFIIIVCTKGKVQAGHMTQAELVYLIFYEIVSVGIRAAVSEGILFWGLLFYLLRKEFGEKRGIFLCGFYYGIVRVILDMSFFWSGADGYFQLFLQFFFFILMGTAFAFVTCETGSIWTSAVIHALYNVLYIDSHILCIDTGQSFPAVFTYTVEKKSLFFAGGVSWPAIAGFLTIITMAAAKMKNPEKRKTR